MLTFADNFYKACEQKTVGNGMELRNEIEISFVDDVICTEIVSRPAYRNNDHNGQDARSESLVLVLSWWIV